MPRHDWLVGRDRQSEAAERIYAAAADLIARREGAFDPAMEPELCRLRQEYFFKNM